MKGFSMPTNAFNLENKIIAITGGAGVLGAALATGYAKAGARILILDLDIERAKSLAKELGPQHLAARIDVLDPESIQSALDFCIAEMGSLDVLVNGAGGNHPKATTGPDMSFFNIPKESLEFVSGLNLSGTILPSQVFGRYLADKKSGCILNISSMNAFTPLTRIPAYSAAKAAVSNFTQWLAVHMAQEYSPNIRVNAVAPGFFLTAQNRFLLTDKENGELTQRGQQIIDHTPQGRFGDPEDLIGTATWLVSDAAKFVTGIVVPVDGGFSAYSGV
ncbi:MAG: SDR family oxidoreductase [Candidatus Marinimicrobia bacterium]|jgi:NAD(P)-dependent dehydrogenase (short-subunit alcohol dehydrogenase family)|nr:SDR family oxidoreductase [Candidatus Neomarinimicrobiota bacterium]MBT3630416.1 SDR family oxidoreductase [Candidatus Neomarinimicrobiota bacterium]MBT3823735.1 SDR family oxidoreductase [Candidatus Neomarinimicrobiota bacterium]MBT4131916.1 SDR family oxidoreductase [Candidatus Neomarinimicrobiota bacterium]MBT4294642.1 SDR family oxidoreductase [Candidatus Neomarinimicrobiota bacterium]